MANKIEGNKRGGSRAVKDPRAASEKFASPIHELLGMTQDEVEADIASRGKTKASVAKAFGRMEKKVRAEFSELLEDPRTGTGSALRRDFRMDSALFRNPAAAPKGLSERSAASRMLAATARLDDRHLGPLAMAKAGGPMGDDDDMGDEELVMLDTASEPRHGDIVLVHVEGKGQALRQLALFPDGSAALETVDGHEDDREVGHPSNFIIYGVVVGRVRGG